MTLNSQWLVVNGEDSGVARLMMMTASDLSVINVITCWPIK